MEEWIWEFWGFLALVAILTLILVITFVVYDIYKSYKIEKETKTEEKVTVAENLPKNKYEINSVVLFNDNNVVSFGLIIGIVSKKEASYFCGLAFDGISKKEETTYKILKGVNKGLKSINVNYYSKTEIKEDDILSLMENKGQVRDW